LNSVTKGPSTNFILDLVDLVSIFLASSCGILDESY
jgi:hypothetical protein